MKPTIGRKLWFWLNASSAGAHGTHQPQVFNPDQPLDATVVCVHGDRMVNLFVVDHGGFTHSIRSVTLRQEGDAVPTGMYCEWMPYQVRKENKPESTVPVPDSAIEAEIQAKGLTAPRVTPAHIASLMQRVKFTFNVEGTSTFCHAFLDGEFLLATGHSACVSKENFDAEIGEKIAKGNVMKPASDKLWELEGYLLRNKLRQE